MPLTLVLPSKVKHGNFHVICRPFWLSPRQAVVIPVAPAFDAYAKKVSVSVLSLFSAIIFTVLKILCFQLQSFLMSSCCCQPVWGMSPWQTFAKVTPLATSKTSLLIHKMLMLFVSTPAYLCEPVHTEVLMSILFCHSICPDAKPADDYMNENESKENLYSALKSLQMYA